MKSLSTERLTLREFTHDDATFVLELHQHPDLVRFIPSAALTDSEGAHQRIDLFNSVDHPDYGWWCVSLHDGTPVGAVILKPIRNSEGVDRDDVEVGWRQHAAHTGHGYMTEAAQAAIDHGFNSGLDRIIAVVDPQNIRSQRVCGRLGMSHLGRTNDYYDVELELYALERTHP